MRWAGIAAVFRVTLVVTLASGCTSAREPPAVPFGGPEVASYPLSCASCMALYREQCTSPAALPVAAVVSGAKVIDESGHCSTSDDPGASQPCQVRSALHFGSVQFLRNTGQAASATDTFLGHHVRERLQPAQRSGVILEPDKTYMIFAGRTGDRREPAGDWYISIACELKE